MNNGEAPADWPRLFCSNFQAALLAEVVVLVIVVAKVHGGNVFKIGLGGVVLVVRINVLVQLLLVVLFF